MSLQIRADFPGMSLAKTQFQIGIRPAPDERNAGHPILAVDSFARPRVFFCWQDARLGINFRASDNSANRTRRDPHLRIVRTRFVLPISLRVIT